jgi:hypothetical protein
VVDERDRHADRVETVEEVRSSVERVDEPFDVGPVTALFLAVHS